MSAEAFIPTNPLEEALRAAALEPAAGRALLAALADEPLLVRVRSAPGPDGEVELPLVEHEGQDYVFVFTSDTQLQRAGYGTSPRIELTGRLLARIWPPRASMAINPQGDLGLSLPAAAVATLDGTPGEMGRLTIPQGSKVMIGEPAEEPVALLQELSAAAAELPEVAAMHRAWVFVQDRGDPPFLVVGVRLTPTAANADGVLGRLADVAGDQASLLVLDDGAPGAIGAWMLERNAPFYEAAA
jgi:SseB protein C-terminal domain/SseB protein N-terminal domain